MAVTSIRARSRSVKNWFKQGPIAEGPDLLLVLIFYRHHECLTAIAFKPIFYKPEGVSIVTLDCLLRVDNAILEINSIYVDLAKKVTTNYYLH